MSGRHQPAEGADSPRALASAGVAVGVPIEAIELLADPATPPEDRAALYALLHQVQLRINRALRKARDELVTHMERHQLRSMGPVSVRATPIDVAWPCNDPGNWQDAGVQDALATYRRMAPELVRHVPDHLELDTAALGAGVAAGDPVAIELHRAAKAAGWRTEAGRRLSLAVREAHL